MNKTFTRKLLASALMIFAFQSAGAVTVEIKNIYAQVEAVPSGAGEVYISARPDQSSYVKETSGWGSVSTVKATLERNGDDPDGASMYEAIVQAKPAEGYEFVCYSYEPEFPNGIFLAADIYREASSTDGDTRQWSYATEAMGVNGTGAIINVTSPLRNDGNTDNPGKDKLFNEGTWSETPDRYIYAVFRKKGDAYPILDELLPVGEIIMNNRPENGKVYDTSGRLVGDDYKGIVIKNGRKYIRK
jgi:hypothetical protein